MSRRSKPTNKVSKPIRATDVEWETIRARARERGMDMSEFILACAMAPGWNAPGHDGKGGGLHWTMQARLLDLLEWIADEIGRPYPASGNDRGETAGTGPTPRQAVRAIQMMGRGAP